MRKGLGDLNEAVASALKPPPGKTSRVPIIKRTTAMCDDAKRFEWRLHDLAKTGQTARARGNAGYDWLTVYELQGERFVCSLSREQTLTFPEDDVVGVRVYRLRVEGDVHSATCKAWYEEIMTGTRPRSGGNQ